MFSLKPRSISLQLIISSVVVLSLSIFPGFLNSQGGGGGELRAPSAAVILNPSNPFQEVQINSSEIITITLTDLTPDIAFGVIQVNSFLQNVTISYNPTLSRGYFTTGVSTGLVIFNNGISSASVYLSNPNANPAQVLLGWHVYDSNAPIPGGCNLEESIQTAPFLPTRFTKSLLYVVYPLGSWPLNVRPATCDRYPLEYDIYQYYLPERDVSAQTLFASLRLMSDVNSIQANGRQVQYYGTPPSRIEFVNYVGTGRIVAVIARDLTSSAAYVPTVTFGCTPGSDTSDDESCKLLSSTITDLVSALMIFVGLFLTALGHRFYKTQLFLLGFCLASLIFFLIIVGLLQVELQVATAVSIFLGVVGGALLLLVWARWGAPVLPVFLACLAIGAIFASIMSYTPLADYAIFKDTVTFWLAFASMILVGPLVFFSFPRMASIVFTTFVGSYLFISAVDQFTGSNMKFIIINVIRRVTVPGFGMSIVDPPFQTTDFLLTVTWAILTIAGTVFQVWREKGRVPFPAPPTWPLRRNRPTTSRVPDEASPLLNGRTV